MWSTVMAARRMTEIQGVGQMTYPLHETCLRYLLIFGRYCRVDQEDIKAIARESINPMTSHIIKP